jgi:hypothetical protein
MGKRGEGWVILQALLLLVILFAPRIVSLGLPWWVHDGEFSHYKGDRSKVLFLFEG